MPPSVLSKARWHDFFFILVIRCSWVIWRTTTGSESGKAPELRRHFQGESRRGLLAVEVILRNTPHGHRSVLHVTSSICYSDEGHKWLMHLCISTRTLVGPQRFNSGSICPSTPFERELSFTSPSKRAVESQNVWRVSNTDAPVYLHHWAVSPALCSRSSEREKKLSGRPTVSSFFQSFRRDGRRQSPISQLICQISQLIFDRSHVNASHSVPTCKVIDLRTMDRLCVRGPNGRVDGQRKRRMEGENAVFGFHIWQSGAEQSTPFTRDRPLAVHAQWLSFRAQSVLPPHLSANLVSPAHPNELRNRKTFCVTQTRMPPCTCIDGPFRSHFARARATRKRSFRINWQCLASHFRTFGRSISDLQLICQRSRLICDRSHVHALHDVPDEQWNKRPWWIARFPRRARFSACKHATHLERKNRTGSPFVRTSCCGLAKLLAPWKWERFSVGYQTLSSPCAAVFITHSAIFKLGVTGNVHVSVWIFLACSANLFASSTLVLKMDKTLSD